MRYIKVSKDEYSYIRRKRRIKHMMKQEAFSDLMGVIAVIFMSLGFYIIAVNVY